MFTCPNMRAAFRLLIAVLMAALSSFAVSAPTAAQTMSDEQIRAAIAQQREAASSIERENEPVAWAAAQTELAKRLYESFDHDSLVESAALYRAALEVLTPETTRTEWLIAEEGLGDTLLMIASLRSGASAVAMFAGAPAYVDPGVDSRDAALAFRAVLRFQSRESDGVAWAQLQNKLGWALATWTIRQRLIQAHSLEADATQSEAEVAFRDALSAISLEQHPEEWASTNEGLTNLYSMAAQFITRERPKGEAALRRSEARRVSYVEAAIASTREAERAYQRLGDEQRLQYTRQNLERLNEALRPSFPPPQ
jgi:hypothetical protein